MMGTLPAVLLALIAATGSFTRFLADDYCSAYWAERFGLLRSVWHWYITWSGRFSAYASDWFVTPLGARNVRFIPPILLLIWLAASAIALWSLLYRKQTAGRGWLIPILLGIILLFTVFTTMPSVPQSFYWWNGMRSYTLPLILLTILAALYPWTVKKARSRGTIVLASAASFIFLFANAGLSDTYAVVQLGLLGILLLLAVMERPRENAAIAILAAGAAGTVLALAVIALAPGNVYREASFPPHPGILRLLIINAQGYGALLWGILSAPQKLSALIGALLAGIWAGYAVAEAPLARPPAIAVVLAIGLLLSFGAMLPASWGLSEPGPSRNMSVPVFALVVSLMAAGVVAGSGLPRGAAGPAVVPWTIALLAVVALNASAIVGIQRAYAERMIYVQYAQNWDAEEAQILEAKASGAGSVTVVSWPNWAGLDVFSDHSKNWLNACAGGYYGIEVIGRAP